METQALFQYARSFVPNGKQLTDAVMQIAQDAMNLSEEAKAWEVQKLYTGVTEIVVAGMNHLRENASIYGNELKALRKDETELTKKWPETKLILSAYKALSVYDPAAADSFSAAQGEDPNVLEDIWTLDTELNRKMNELFEGTPNGPKQENTPDLAVNHDPEEIIRNLEDILKDTDPDVIHVPSPEGPEKEELLPDEHEISISFSLGTDQSTISGLNKSVLDEEFDGKSLGDFMKDSLGSRDTTEKNAIYAWYKKTPEGKEIPEVGERTSEDYFRDAAADLVLCAMMDMNRRNTEHEMVLAEGVTFSNSLYYDVATQLSDYGLTAARNELFANADFAALLNPENRNMLNRNFVAALEADVSTMNGKEDPLASTLADKALPFESKLNAIFDAMEHERIGQSVLAHAMEKALIRGITLSAKKRVADQSLFESQKGLHPEHQFVKNVESMTGLNLNSNEQILFQYVRNNTVEGEELTDHAIRLAAVESFY